MGEDFLVHFPIETKDPLERVERYIERFRSPKYTGFDALLMRSLRALSVETPSRNVSKAVFEIKIIPEFSNPMGNMHGGAVALLFDMCTTVTVAPLASKDFWHFGGVSRTLNITYLKPVRVGSTVKIETEVKGIGSRLSTIQAAMIGENGEVLCLGEHGKAALDIPESNSKSKI